MATVLTPTAQPATLRIGATVRATHWDGSSAPYTDAPAGSKESCWSWPCFYRN
jgi:hypothetical protein